jgi:hypothetical protein
MGEMTSALAVPLRRAGNQFGGPFGAEDEWFNDKIENN